MLIHTDWPRLFALAAGHRLETLKERSDIGRGARRSTRWFAEYDADARLVARYRGWSVEAGQVGRAGQVGWERYAPDGTLLLREVRYATREEAERLH